MLASPMIRGGVRDRDAAGTSTSAAACILVDVSIGGVVGVEISPISIGVEDAFTVLDDSDALSCSSSCASSTLRFWASTSVVFSGVCSCAAGDSGEKTRVDSSESPLATS